MADDELVTVYETVMREQAAIVRLALEEAGIRFVTANDVVSHFYPVDGMAKLAFQVLARDADAAREVIGGLRFAEPKEE
jgi:hypothetical protein